jgi:hypothetical protein
MTIRQEIMFSIFVAATIVMKHLAILALIAMIGSPGAAYAAEPVELATFGALARHFPRCRTGD